MGSRPLILGVWILRVQDILSLMGGWTETSNWTQKENLKLPTKKIFKICILQIRRPTFDNSWLGSLEWLYVFATGCWIGIPIHDLIVMLPYESKLSQHNIICLYIINWQNSPHWAASNHPSNCGWCMLGFDHPDEFPMKDVLTLTLKANREFKANMFNPSFQNFNNLLQKIRL